MRYRHPTDGKVMCGDVGTVIGPCNKKYLSQCHERINCTFNRYHGAGGLNVFVSQIYRLGATPTLPKQLQIGNSVLAMFAFESDHGSVKHGDEGTGEARCTYSHGTWHTTRLKHVEDTPSTWPS